jgi:hypothetical protein
MFKSGIDQDALVQMFSQATVKQGEALRKAVGEATLKALQARELTMENVRKVLKTVTQATSAGAAQNAAGAVDVEAMLGKAFSGMDAALLQVVEANRKALQQFVDQGMGLQEKQLKDALANVEKMEDVFFATVSKAAQSAGGSSLLPWQHVLDAMKIKGTDTGAGAAATAEQLLARAQKALRDGRASGVRAAQAMLDSYASMVSGVLIGMSEGLRDQGEGEPVAEARVARKRKS